jgi:hypothetical protein
MRPMPRGVVDAVVLPALLVLVAVLPGSSRPASATVCHTENVPAATLLLPYFEVNLDDPNGLTTLFSVNNASAVAVLAHVSIWSDLAVPVLNFNVYLTGYDVQTINLRDVIVFGNLPQTASSGQDPSDTISPKGDLSQDINFASCQGLLPPPPLPAAYLTHLQDALTGNPSPILKGLCAGQALGDHIARGYVTVDTVDNCTLRFPGDAGYFGAAGAGDVTDQNVLWGGWFIVNSKQGFAHASNMVAVEADGSDPATTTPGRYTFYGRYDGWTAIDHREPLATTFAAQFADGGPFTAGSSYIVWRDSKVPQGAFSCPATPGNVPSWYPLGQEGLTIFDEQEHEAIPFVCPFAGSSPSSATPSQCPPFMNVPFPAAAQRVQVNGARFPVPFTFGWTYLDLNWSDPPFDGNNPPADPHAAQAWVIATESSFSHFALALDAYRLDSACSPNHFHPQ